MNWIDYCAANPSMRDKNNEFRVATTYDGKHTVVVHAVRIVREGFVTVCGAPMNQDTILTKEMVAVAQFDEPLDICHDCWTIARSRSRRGQA